MPLRILFLTQIVPYPPDAGPKVKTWHVIRYLVEKGHQVHLVSFTRQEEEPFIPFLRQICTEVYPVPIRRSRIADIGYFLRSLVTGRPFLVERDDLKEMRRVVSEILRQVPIDYIHADQLSMTQFALPAPRIIGARNSKQVSFRERPYKRVFDAHNAVWTIVKRMSEKAPFYLKPLAILEYHRMKRYEGMLLNTFDHTLTVTKFDQRDLLAANASSKDKNNSKKSQISIIPIAIDTEQLQPVQRPDESKEIFTMGTLHYPPNADGIRWFVREVFPLVRAELPEVKLTIAGKNPPSDLIQLAQASGGAVRVVGFVPDLIPYMQRAALIVVPVRAGSGMRVRILEAFSSGMPVITTTVGLEGIDAREGEDVLVADKPEDFAREVIHVLNDSSLQQKLATNSRQLAVQKYDWKQVLTLMDKIYVKNEDFD